MKSKITKVGEPFTLTVTKIEFYSFSSIAVPFYSLNDGRVIGGVRLDSFKKTHDRAILEEARFPMVVINSLVLHQMSDGKNYDYEFAKKMKMKVFEEDFKEPQSITLQEVSSPEWEGNKYEYLGSTAFFLNPELSEILGNDKQIGFLHDIQFSVDWDWALLTLYMSPTLVRYSKTLEDAMRVTLRTAVKLGIVEAFMNRVKEHQPFDSNKHNILVNTNSAPWRKIKSWESSARKMTGAMLQRIFEEETGIKVTQPLLI